jgi:uncharacterized damage-inducible protein DinB
MAKSRKRPGGREEGSARETPLTDRDAALLTAWRTNCRVTAYLVENIPAALWDVPIPAAPRRTVRMIAAHLHNVRCSWLKVLGREHGIAVPALVDRRKVAPRHLLSALERSSKGIEALLELGIATGGQVPPSKAYVWRNLPLDVPHVLTYFVAHEGHHRGQIVMLARQLGHRLPTEICNGLWHWTKRVQEEVRERRTKNEERRTKNGTKNKERRTERRTGSLERVEEPKGR